MKATDFVTTETRVERHQALAGHVAGLISQIEDVSRQITERQVEVGRELHRLTLVPGHFEGTMQELRDLVAAAQFEDQALFDLRARLIRATQGV